MEDIRTLEQIALEEGLDILNEINVDNDEIENIKSLIENELL